MSLPRVSIVIPNYNHARYLPRCLDAVLTQSVPPDEVIVIDDGSTDDSRQVLEAYAARSARLLLRPNERNLGVTATVNRGLNMATGDYVGFFAADDEILPGHFEASLPLLSAHPEAGAVSGLCEWRCEATGLTWLQGAGMPDVAGYHSPDELVGLSRAGRFSLASQHALFQRTALLRAGGWFPELRWFSDCFSSWVVGFRHGLCHVPRVLSLFHTAPTSYYHSGKVGAQRREVLAGFIQLLEGERYADVAPRIRASGLIGSLGGFALRVVLVRGEFRPYLNAAFLRHTVRRTAEIVGRKILPGPVARLASRAFYGKR